MGAIGRLGRHSLSQTSLPRSSGAVILFDVIVIGICLIVVPSAVIHGLLGTDERAVFGVLGPTVLLGALFQRGRTVPESVPLMLLIVAVLGTAATVVADSLSQLFMSAGLMVAIVVGHQLYATLMKGGALLTVSWFCLAMLVGGVAGLLYSAAGGPPLLVVQIGYRATELYLSTFSLARVGEFIRPSGIFDEPGSLAMYVAIVTMFNDVLGRSRRLNFILVCLMVTTGSLAGVIVAILYLISSNALRKKRKEILAGVGFVLGIAVFAHGFLSENVFYRAIDKFYLDRIQVAEGRLVGDNRSGQVETFFKLVDVDVILRGAKASGMAYVEDQSSNPFSITFGYGLLISLPYFVLLIWLLYHSVRSDRRVRYAALGLFVLLLQRPYIYHMSWSIIIAATVWLVHLGAGQPGRVRLRQKSVADSRGGQGAGTCKPSASVLA